jgi:DHA2 family multidrug resistance protein
MAVGFSCIAFACVLNANYTSLWAAPNYYPSELLMAVGQSFAFIGLVSTIVLQAMFSGGLSKPQWVLTFSAFFHLVRLFGGQIGATFMGHFIAEREKFHSNLVGLHVQQGSWVTESGFGALSAGLFSKSSGAPEAMSRALGVVSSRIRLQAYTLSFIDGFHLVAWGCVLALLVIALLRKSPLNYGDLSAFDEGRSPLRMDNNENS